MGGSPWNSTSLVIHAPPVPRGWILFLVVCAGEGSSSNVEGASGSAQNNSNTQPATGSEGGPDRDANPLEPFLALDDSNRRLHGKGYAPN